MNIQIHEAQRTPSSLDINRSLQKHVINKQRKETNFCFEIPGLQGNSYKVKTILSTVTVSLVSVRIGIEHFISQKYSLVQLKLMTQRKYY